MKNKEKIDEECLTQYGSDIAKKDLHLPNSKTPAIERLLASRCLQMPPQREPGG